MPDIDDSWRSILAALPNTLASIWVRDSEDVRTALVAVVKAAEKAPSHVLNLYADWPEGELRSDAQDMQASLGQPGFGYLYAPDDADLACLDSLVRLIRALEFAASGYSLGDYPANPNVDWRVTLPDGAEYFLVPLPRRIWGRGYDMKTDERAFSKRCLIMHRVIPTKVDGTLVTFVPMRSVRRLSRDPIRFGAAVFEKADFGDAENQNPFRVTQVELGDFDAVARDAVSKSHQLPFFALVFPELTINEESLETLRELLKNKPFDKPLAMLSPTIVVAGSWHVLDGDRNFNVATILDGQGAILATYRKRHSYGGQGRPREDIVSGTEFPILLSPEGMVGFAICLDFCNHGTPTLYEQVDVDFVLVPSCGNTSTMEGHLHTAYELSKRYSTISFVSQQSHPGELPTRGYVSLWEDKPVPTSEKSKVSQMWAERFTVISSFPVDIP